MNAFYCYSLFHNLAFDLNIFKHIFDLFRALKSCVSQSQLYLRQWFWEKIGPNGLNQKSFILTIHRCYVVLMAQIYQENSLRAFKFFKNILDESTLFDFLMKKLHFFLNLHLLSQTSVNGKFKQVNILVFALTKTKYFKF